jgi:hypothetical protein
MSKLILFCLSLFCLSTLLYGHTSKPPFTSGKLRIYFAGFDCNNATSDNMFNLDGFGDEVYFNFDLFTADYYGTCKGGYSTRTPVYGSAFGFPATPFQDRIKFGNYGTFYGIPSTLYGLAGVGGGIITDDKFRCNTLLTEFVTFPEEIYSLTPTIWETDLNSEPFTKFKTEFNSKLNLAAQQMAAYAKTASFATLSLGTISISSTISNWQLFNAFASLTVGIAADRPIGMTLLDRRFEAKSLVLPGKWLQAISMMDIGFGKGVVPIRYSEPLIENFVDHGDYTIYIRLEYEELTQNSTSVATASTSTTRTSTAVTSPSISKLDGSTFLAYKTYPTTFTTTPVITALPVTIPLISRTYVEISKSAWPAVYDIGTARELVKEAYQRVLERTPENNALEEKAERLKSGRCCVKDIIWELGNAEEYNNRFVKNYLPNRSAHAASIMYKHFLARDPENITIAKTLGDEIVAKGWQFAVASLLNSSEYKSKFGNATVPK